MLVVLTCPDALIRKGAIDPALVKVLGAARAAGHPVGVISNRAEPAWFGPTFTGSAVQFVHAPGRQDGKIIPRNATNFGLHPFDTLVLAVKDEDVQMGKNGGAVLVAADWSGSPQVRSLGIQVKTPQDLADIITLTHGWAGQWWFNGTTPDYDVRALSDLSGYHKPFDQAEFAARLTATVKGGGARLNSLLTVTARSLLIDGTGAQPDLLWGVYPSSHSTNDDTEVLSEFTHRLRTTVSRARLSVRGEPLFVRHKPSTKRSGGGVGDRTDPTNQIETIHLNPYYKSNKRLKGKRVIVIDDCTTYGVSFGVAAALLREAGAASVTGVALGKFGNQLRHYQIKLLGDPFQPLAATGFHLPTPTWYPGTNNPVSQKVLQSLIS